MLYYCPVCKTQENFDSPLKLKHHIASLPSNGVPFAFPLICIDPLCKGEGSYSSLDSYIAHIRKYQHSNNAQPLENTQNGQPFYNAAGGTTPDRIGLEVNDACDSTLNEYENEVRDLLLSMYGNSTIPHVVVTEVVKSFEKFVILLKKTSLPSLTT
jgi:hypothetical protein